LLKIKRKLIILKYKLKHFFGFIICYIKNVHDYNGFSKPLLDAKQKISILQFCNRCHKIKKLELYDSNK
jgi:hypothetical protein